jgi:sugar fermentation stimulation protein A
MAPIPPNLVDRRVGLPLAADLEGHFVRRYKRFFADIVTDDGRELTVHCANPGGMLGFQRPGARIRCSTSDDPKRKLRHTLEMMRIGRIWVGLQTHRANALIERALLVGVPETLAGYGVIRREARVDGGSRLDFRLSEHSHRRAPAFVEVKTVTLAEGRTALFPDSVTERGRRHLETLIRLRSEGARAVSLFAVLRADCDRVAPADAIDPAYGDALRAARRAGVEILAVGARVTARAITIERTLPVEL